ncbi:Uncharacterised protein [Bordetella ansorpii]|uniref:Outer membrane protein n=1 Tax=Bordetella ansorpii TaxID=288768 RepID=A0A157QYS6_9BORD|nr:hypothetical protein [Bordetella ansorpii]SAI50857.1 Uncharacterised protein [Bordetella ansorpii]
MMRYVPSCTLAVRGISARLLRTHPKRAAARSAAVFAATLACQTAGAQEVYGNAGFLGAGIGYAQGISESFTVRADFSTMGTIKHSGTTNDYDYDGKFRSNQAMVYADWFPFDAGFRLTAGIGWREMTGSAEARPDENGRIRIGDTRLRYREGDRARARLDFPRIAPYLGIGWGHNVVQREKGWGFIADIGVLFGKPDVNIDVTPALYTRLGIRSGDAQREIDKQRNKMQDDANSLRFFPQAYVGVSYTF